MLQSNFYSVVSRLMAAIASKRRATIGIVLPILRFGYRIVAIEPDVRLLAWHTGAERSGAISLLV